MIQVGVASLRRAKHTPPKTEKAKIQSRAIRNIVYHQPTGYTPCEHADRCRRCYAPRRAIGALKMLENKIAGGLYSLRTAKPEDLGAVRNIVYHQPTGYTPCEYADRCRRCYAPRIVKRCTRRAICARSLECEHSDSTTLDYVAFGSSRSGEAQMLDGPPAKQKATPKGVAFCWWTIKDSNLGPTGYEPVALTN